MTQTNNVAAMTRSLIFLAGLLLLMVAGGGCSHQSSSGPPASSPPPSTAPAQPGTKITTNPTTGTQQGVPKADPLLPGEKSGAELHGGGQ